jgi:hypothetical protein
LTVHALLTRRARLKAIAARDDKRAPIAGEAKPNGTLAVNSFGVPRRA